MIKRFFSARSWLQCIVRSEHGSTAAEYALLATLIAVVIIGSVTLFGTNVLNLYNMIATSF